MTTDNNIHPSSELTTEIKTGLKFDLYSGNITYYFVLTFGLLIAGLNLLKVFESGPYAIEKWAFYAVFAVMSIIVGLLLWRGMINRFNRKDIIKAIRATEPTLAAMKELGEGIQLHTRKNRLTVFKLGRSLANIYSMLILNLGVLALSSLAFSQPDEKLNIDYVYTQLILAGISATVGLIFTIIVNIKYKKILSEP